MWALATCLGTVCSVYLHVRLSAAQHFARLRSNMLAFCVFFKLVIFTELLQSGPGPQWQLFDLQLVLNASTRVITGTRKFGLVMCQILHNELHWLDVPDWVFFKLAVTVHRCLNTTIPVGLLCCSRWCWHSAAYAFCQLLAIACFQICTYGRRAFSFAGPTVWNSLTDFIRDLAISADCFRRLLKTYLLARYECIQRIRGCWL